MITYQIEPPALGHSKLRSQGCRMVSQLAEQSAQAHRSAGLLASVVLLNNSWALIRSAGV